MKITGLSYKHTVYSSYIGYITQAIVNIFAPLLFVTFKDEFEISISQITLITSLNFFTQLFVDALSAGFVDRIGYRKCIVAAHIFCAAGLCGLAVLPSLLNNPYVGILISVVMYAVGGGLIEVLISPIVEACPSDDKASAMSLLHSFYCWGSVGVILISTVFFALFSMSRWRILAVLWAIIPAANAVMFLKVPINKLTNEGDKMSIKSLFSVKLFWVFIILMLCAGASELAMSQWASAFCENGLGISKTLGDLAGPCLFSVLMGSARVFYSKYSAKIDLLGFIIGSSALCIFAYLMASLSPVPVISLFGCALSGLSVGILWPGVFSLASKSFPKGGTAMFAILALAGDMGCTSGPALVGFVSDIFSDSLKLGILAACIFPAVMLSFSLYLKYSDSRLNRRNNKNQGDM